MELVGYVRARLSRGGYAVSDATGEGAGIVSRSNELELDVRAFVAGTGNDARDSSRLYGFANQRSAAWWRFREALADPDSEIALPPDSILLGELVAPTWWPTSTAKIQVESKDEVAARLRKLESRKAFDEGGSTNRADAVIQAFAEGQAMTSVWREKDMVIGESEMGGGSSLGKEW